MQTSPDQPGNYGHALELMQYEIQRLWTIFGIFLLSETVLLGSLMTAFKDAPALLVCGGASLGLVIILPWWAAFDYCREYYLLRIDQARKFEGSEGFLTEGNVLHQNGALGKRRITWFMKLGRPQLGGRYLMILFTVAFLAIWIIRMQSP